MSLGSNFGIHRPTESSSPPPPPAPMPAPAAQINNPNSTMIVSTTVHAPNTVATGIDDRTQGQILSDFLLQLEDYNSTIPDSVTSHYLNTAGFEATDPRIVRLISIAAQKFISDVANDALQHCKTRTNNVTGSSGGAAKNQKLSKDRKYTLTMEDLTPALGDYGITVRKAQYFV